MKSICLQISSIVITGFILASCAPQPEASADNSTVEEITEEFVFERLSGKWADLSDETQFYEVWQKAEGGMTGTGVVMANGDTVFIEHLGIVHQNEKWFYSARIDGANNNQPVFFEYIEKRDGYWVFENEAHDFPKLIVYDFRGADSLLITISGAEEDSARVEQFRMKKIE